MLRPADAGSRGALARLGLAALFACVGLSWTAGASAASAIYDTVTIKMVNQGGDQADRFHFTSSTAIAQTGDLWVSSGGEYTTRTVHATPGAPTPRRATRRAAPTR